MKPTEIWQRWLFISILAFIAISVNVFFSSFRRGPVYYQPEARRVIQTPVSPPYSPPAVEPKPVPVETRPEPERRSRERDYDSGRSVFEEKQGPIKVILVPSVNPEIKNESAPPPPRQKTPEEIAQEHADYVAKYVNVQKREPGAKMVAVAIVTEQSEFNRSLATITEERIKSGQMKALQSQFTPSFIADGLFTEAFGGAMSVFDKLDLAMSLDAILLGRQTVDYEQHPSLANTITASMKLELIAVPLGRKGQVQSWTFYANGPGFSEKQARSMAEERIAKQIKEATNLSILFN